jgi:methionyl-tRNA formyltransferase
LPVTQPENLSTTDIQAQLMALEPDLLVVVAYGLLLPQAVLEIPVHGCINVHASLLPRWRGASPIQAAILAGDPVTGVSIMQMEAGLDTGPVFSEMKVTVEDGECTGDLHDRLAEAGARLLATSLDGILNRTTVPRLQDEAESTYAGRISKSDAPINWNDSAVEITRQVRAYNPWPVAETMLDGERVRVWRADPDALAKDRGQPGTVVDVGSGTIDIQAGQGLVRVTELQFPGGQKMPAADFVRGHDLLGRTFGIV